MAMFTYLIDSVYTLNWGGWVLEMPDWVRGGSSFSVRGGGGLKFDNKKYFTVMGSRGPPPQKLLISKGFLMQSKAYRALFPTQYITKS